MTDLVVDASVAIKWFVAEPDALAAERLLRVTNNLAAPRLLLTEIANGLRKNFFRKTIRRETVFASLSEAGRLIDTWHEDAPLLEEALEMSLTLNHPIYDCIYLSLARSLGAVCITADERLVGKVAGTKFARLTVGLTEWEQTS